MTEIKSGHQKNSGTDNFIGLVVSIAFGTVFYVFVMLMILGLKLSSEAPQRDHIRSLREATCAKNGMVLLDDKYHPAVCAFEVDEEGNRVP
ncbi:hypothetical protein [Rhizobium sp. BK176]|uniref:hypothetical protein n=1 Tax=Rhizobium sp. BK176 TaxID=2587071 RepID=UPI002167D8D2|nr:hypothetical protein [Rhizobium sp. BK176]MCS4089275.1 hypothetical protein [Rhizobium sp. BK176]